MVSSRLILVNGSTSLKQDKGATPKVTCHDTSTDESSCSCKCTNGIHLDRPFSYFLQGNGINCPSSDDCEASKEKLETDAQACAAHGDALTRQLDACTLREKESTSQAETCAVRERHSNDQLEACTARANDLVEQLGGCAAREKDSIVQLDACTVRENDLVSQYAACTTRDQAAVARETSLNDQIAALKKQATLDSSAISNLQAEFDKLKGRCGTYKLKGCWTDTNSRMLSSARKVGDNQMSTYSCSQFCKNYKYFGTEFGTECYCGNALGTGMVYGNQCNMACAGATAEICGGSMRLSVYENLLL